MLLLSKPISQLLLPPGGLILLGIIGLFFWRRNWGKAFAITAFALLWLFSTEPVRDMLTSPLEFKYSALNIESTQNKHTAIVLLGGGIQKNAPDYQGRDELGHTSMMRTIYAAKIAQQTGFNIYPTGGSPLSQGSETEAHAMKRWLTWFGIPESNIIIENKANTTWENAIFSKQNLAQHNINNIILVTSAWHMPRAIWCFESQGLHVTPAPTDYLTEQGTYNLRSFLPHWNVLSDSSNALREHLGFIWYKIKY